MRRVWNCTVVFWKVLCASILRIDLEDATATLERLVAHLARHQEHTRIRALDRLATILHEKPG